MFRQSKFEEDQSRVGKVGWYAKLVKLDRRSIDGWRVKKWNETDGDPS